MLNKIKKVLKDKEYTKESKKRLFEIMLEELKDQNWNYGKIHSVSGYEIYELYEAFFIIETEKSYKMVII